jgi:hypothetical protein
MKSRKKLASGAAAVAAARVIPDPDAEELPPHEERRNPPIATKDRGWPWSIVIDEVSGVDVEAVYRRLREDLSLGENAHAYGEIHSALDRADRNWHDSVLLARAAKLEQEGVDREVQTRLEVLRTTARAELEQEKADGKRSKAPTIEEVTDRCRANWPDEWESLHRRSDEIHAARSSCEGLQAAWGSRSQSLRRLVDRYVAGGA